MAENLRIPKISVIMPLYNGEKYLKEAIDSILHQTYADFELLLIDDASSDNTENVIRSYNDNRIVYIKNEENLGLIKTLNKGLNFAKGEFIARMDQDDIADVTRFKKQINLFEKNPDLGVCGTWFTCFGDQIKERVLDHPENDEDIKISLLGRSTLGHPTVMMRKSAIQDLRYDENYTSAEDYEFWIRLSRVTKLQNIPESLLQYRFHDSNISVLDQPLQAENAKKIIGNQLKYIGLNHSDSNIKMSEILFGNFYIHYFSDSEFKKLTNFANNLESRNKQKKFYNENILNNTINQRLLTIFNKTEKNISLISFLLKNRKEIITKRRFLANAKMIAKIILKK